MLNAKNESPKASVSTTARMMGRRGFVAGGLALGASVLAAPLTGCSFLGIEDPNAEEEKTPVATATTGSATAQTVDFENLIISFDMSPASWTWSQIKNAASPNNGCLVVALPVSAQNNDDYQRVLSGLYCKIVAPDGSVQSDISAYYTNDDILQQGAIGVNTTSTGVLHVLYRGAGTYSLEFDNLLGGKAQLPLQISGYESSGLRPIPDALGTNDVGNAIPYGESFDVGGLTLTFSSDEATFGWVQSYDDTNSAWNERWCVGVPLTVTNNSKAPASISADMYGLFAPTLFKLEDAAPWFPNSSLAYIGTLAPGQTVPTAMFWPYVDDGWYYVAFDNAGKPAIASVRIAQYS